ncbi:30S ribosomal protein S10 [bacterium]|nr:30S ribosomal protein S10 [bacterium]
MERLRIKLSAYDHRILDKITVSIIKELRKNEGKIAGPIPLPTRISRYTILRSPFVNKKSREQFEIRIHKRLIELVNYSMKTIEVLNKLVLPEGVEVNLKLMKDDKKE